MQAGGRGAAPRSWGARSSVSTAWAHLPNLGSQLTLTQGQMHPGLLQEGTRSHEASPCPPGPVMKEHSPVASLLTPPRVFTGIPNKEKRARPSDPLQSQPWWLGSNITGGACRGDASAQRSWRRHLVLAWWLSARQAAPGTRVPAGQLRGAGAAGPLPPSGRGNEQAHNLAGSGSHFYWGVTGGQAGTAAAPWPAGPAPEATAPHPASVPGRCL